MKAEKEASSLQSIYNLEEAEGEIRKIYQTTASQAELQKSLDLFGYKILNSPPVFRPEILFIGYQPGGGVAEWVYERSRGNPPTRSAV
jgi:hypothetical protein